MPAIHVGGNGLMAPSTPLAASSSSSSSDSASLFSPRDAKDVAAYNRATTNPSNYAPGGGTVEPFSINNNAVLALFGLLGAALVLASIWFFFWAKNGGFKFRKGDWDDYKSTVLRRKGPNGTTLSGATKSTDLGGGSIVGSQGSYSDITDPEKEAGEHSGAAKKTKKTQTKARHDEDVRAYRNEKVARVGGMNRAADGSYHDPTSSDISSSSRGGSQPAHKYAATGRETIKPVMSSNPIGRQFSFNAGTESGFSAASDDSHRPLNPPRQHQHQRQSQRGGGGSEAGVRSHQGRQYQQASSSSSPLKRASGVPAPHRAQPSVTTGSYTEPLDFDSRYAPSEAASHQVRNTKAYAHPIPGLSSNNAGPSRGFRRGMPGGRDNLSDSEDGY